MSSTLVILPTYNESENIQIFLRDLLTQVPEVDCLVVDDRSPDGTFQLVQEMLPSYPQLSLLIRDKKEGLGRAYVAGFQWALQRNYQQIVQMDADFSHRFVDLKKILKVSTDDMDFIVGTRWIPEGGVSNWSVLRQWVSRFGNFYVRAILGTQFHDWTGGFNLWKSKVLRQIPLDSLEALGYCFQVELKFWALRLKFRAKEVPIVFEERRFGQSKMSMRIISEALVKVWQMRFRKSLP